jgi:UDP-N-acetylglucosamine--N-acetylmuramyl-(pentapeptide) pyrophosphoryl-undecaprenol N-acetylglucosamine transferase
MQVLLAGGGTAGHVEPALATADALRRLDPEVQATLLGTARGLERRLVPARGYPLELIPAVPLPRRPSLDLLRLPTRLRAAVASVAEVIDRSRIDAVVGFGGYVALPAYLAARRRHVPVVVHEANARPGLANRVGARFAAAVAVATPAARLPHATHVGMPLRAAVTGLDRARERAAARERFEFDRLAPVLFVFGGSQGARRLNLTVLDAGAQLMSAGVQVLHATGATNFDDVVTAASARGLRAPAYRAVPYLDHIEDGYAAADLAVCRAGAMTVAELTAVGLPAIYVPLPIGNGEQRLNAEPVVAAGGGLTVDDSAMTPSLLAELVLPLVADAGRLEKMSDAAVSLGRRDADVRMARLVLDVASRGTG